MRAEQQVLFGVADPLHGIPREDDRHQLVLLFGPTESLVDEVLRKRIHDIFPDALITGCSTSGEITRDGALDGAVTVTSLKFHSTSLRMKRIPVDFMDGSSAAGRALGLALAQKDLRYVLVLSDGLNVNGSEVVRGLKTELGDSVVISGGLAGDGVAFSRTVVVDGQDAYDKCIVGIGFSGGCFIARSSSASGWETFGTLRTVTKSQGSVVYEIDGASALDVYSKYLGDEAAQLPSSGLYYPLAVRVAEQDAGLIRTLLAVDRTSGSLTFAGDVPEGSTVRLMHASHTQLVEGAARAGSLAVPVSGRSPDFALLVSCVGRKLVMGSNVDLEIEAVAEHLPDCPVFSGFHSYGEIGFYEGSGTCELHNQTMTVTSMSEMEE